MSYIPEKGDIIWIQFNPQRGREQANHRPAIVLTPKKYNEKTSLCVVCPLTSKRKGFPFEVIYEDEKVKSVILSDHVRSLDWRVRKAKFKKKADPFIVEEVLAKLSALIYE